MRRALATVALCGCGGGTGAAIEVTASSSTTTVELFLGNAHVDATAASCPDGTVDSCVIRPPHHSADPTKDGLYQAGKGWVGLALEATRDTAVDGSFGFSIEPDPDGYIPALLVVGYDDAEMPTGIAMLHDLTIPRSPQIFEVELAPARFIEPPGADMDRIHVWRRPGDIDRKQSACALVEKADTSVEWFVPADDTDCDGALPGDDSLAPECGPSDWTHCGHYAGTLSESSCVAPSGTSCRIAGPECVDGGPSCAPGLACTPTQPKACLPKEVCARTAISGCHTFESGNVSATPCVRSILGNLSFNQLVPSLYCAFYVQSPGVPCGSWPMIPPLDLTKLSNGMACESLQLGRLSPTVMFGTEIPVSAAGSVKLVPGTGCTGTLEFIPSAGTGAEGEGLIGILSADARRYVRFSSDLFIGCNSQSYCDWKGPQTYEFPCE